MSCLVIYTVVIQGLLLGFIGAQSAGAGGDSLSGFELCLNGDHGSPSGDSPDGQAGGDSCIFCLADAHHSLAAPSFTSSWRFESAFTQLLPPLGGWRLPPQDEQPGASPRGPPLPA
jgi:hypothetical protein